ncbi:MAG: efflux RND transporter periplasmic adaptor subunit [Pseudomonadota bacterium]
MSPSLAKNPITIVAISGVIGLSYLWPVQAHESHGVAAETVQQTPAVSTPRSITLPGTVVVDARRDLRIVAGQDGVLEAPPGGFALPGQKIAAGQILARLRPTFPQAERRDLSVDYAGAHRDALLSRLQVERYKLDGTQPFDIKLPTPTLKLLADHKSSQVREAQLKRALQGEISIIAPRAGVVLHSTARAGEVVVAGQELFALNMQGGLAVTVDYTDRDFDSTQLQQALTSDNQQVALKFIGKTYDPELRLNRAYFAIGGSASQLAPGEPVQVAAGVGR